MKSEWLTDEEKLMIQKCINGEMAYEKKLYTKYIQAMYSRSVRMMGCEEMAKDAVQEAFIEVFKSLPRFRGESTLGAWIKRIVVRTCIRQLKKENRLPTVELDQVLHTANDRDNIDLEVINANAIHKAIKKLPDGCRNVLNLYLLEGYQHKEIAQIMDISESTSKTQYRRAKMMLRELINMNISE